MRFLHSLVLLSFLLLTANAVHAEEPIPAVVLKVEGEGIANVRKKSGVLESAGVRGKVYVGDRVLTDAKTAVYLLLNDGSVLKVGLNSDLKLERVDAHEKYLSWIFRLQHGSLRVLAERVPAAEVHLKVETSAGTVGVRGTELVMVHDDAAAETLLFVFEGRALFGAPECDKEHPCGEVGDGEMSSLLVGQKKSAPPKKFAMADLFPTTSAEGKKVGGGGAELEARMSLFKDARRVTGRYAQTMDEPSLQKLVEDSRTEFALAQDRAIGRPKAQRAAMAHAMEVGAFDDTLAAADAYAEARGLFHRKTNGGAENFVAQAVAAKFRLGDAVQKADAAGVFSDKIASPTAGSKGDRWNSREFKVRKNFDYDQGEDAKQKRAKLDKALDEYKALLEYMEALPAEQDVAHKDDPDPRKRLTLKVTCSTPECLSAGIAHEIDVSSEGVVNAYQQKQVESTISGRTNKGLPTLITTPYFTRVMPGNGCFRVEKTCKKRPCPLKTKGGACEPGSFQDVCTPTQIPVRCSPASTETK